MNIQSAGVLPALTPPAIGNPIREISRPKAEESAVQAKDQARTISPPTAPEPVAEREKLEAATKVVREFVQPINNNLEFSVDQDSGQTVVKVVDRSTREVIRQVPSEEMLALAKTLDGIKGLFVKQTA